MTLGIRIGLTLGAASLLLAGELSAQERAGDDDDRSGERLYISRGCLGCHGASARGGVGPALAATPLPLSAFVGQLRHPRDIMPAFPEEIVSDEEAEEIHEYLLRLRPDVPRLRADLPQGSLDPATCAECNR